MARINNTPQLNKTAHQSSNPKGRIPAALRHHTPSDGLYQIVSLDLGTGYTSIHTADLQVKSERFTNLKSLNPKHFHRYRGNANHRPELTTEAPTKCAHILGETDESKAQHGLEVDSAGDETGAVIVDTIKEALYSGPEAGKQNETLKALALKIPYLEARYKDTKLETHPEIWILADYIHGLAELVTLSIVEEGFERDLIWVCTIPSNWNKASHKSYTLALDASPFLVGRYILQSEIESAIAGLTYQSPKQSRLEDDDVFFAFDIGKGTSDFSACRQTCSDPIQVEEIMPPAALFAGSSTVLRLWESHIRKQCEKEAEEDPERFESELPAQKARFTERMHVYMGQSGEEVDKVYYIAGQKIKVTRNQMNSWFEEWMRLTRDFVSEQCERYREQSDPGSPQPRPPAKFFLMGGSSNAVVLQKCIRNLLKTPFFRNTELVLLGDCNSATLVAYGAIIRAVTRVMSTRKCHYWIGLARKDPYDKEKHANAPSADIVDDVQLQSYNETQKRAPRKVKKEKFVRVIHWFAKPGDDCIVDGNIDQMPFIKMSEFFDEEGSLPSGERTDYTVPIWVYICSSLTASDVMDNDSGDVAKGLAGKRGCSFQSTRPETERAKFEVDFSPNVPNPLLVERDLVPTIDRFYDVSWTISAETTGIGIDFWCGVYSNGKRSSHTKDDQMNSRMVSRVLFADLVGVIQKSYVLDDESEVENEEGEQLDGEDGEDADAEPEGKRVDGSEDGVGAEEEQSDQDDENADVESEGKQVDGSEDGVGAEEEQNQDDKDADAESEGKEDGKASSRGNDVAQHTVPSVPLFPGLVSHSNTSQDVYATRGKSTRPEDMQIAVATGDKEQAATNPKPHEQSPSGTLRSKDIVNLNGQGNDKNKNDEGSTLNNNISSDDDGDIPATAPTTKAAGELLEQLGGKRKADEVLQAPSKKVKTNDRDLENAFLKLHYSSITKGESILLFVPSAALESAKSDFLKRLKIRIKSPVAKPSAANIGVCSPCILGNKKKSCKARPCQHCEADAKKEKYCTFLSTTKDGFLCAVYGSAGKDAAQEDQTGIFTRMIIGNEEEGYRAIFDK